MENARPMQFKSYPSRSSSDLLDSCQIWEVARATSATPSFFDPIKIGRFGKGFTDGGTGAHNPVQAVWSEARHTFLREEQMLEGNLKCLVSIGTGKPSLRAFSGNLQTVAHTLIRMAADTQNTANSFQSAHSWLRANHQSDWRMPHEPPQSWQPPDITWSLRGWSHRWKSVDGDLELGGEDVRLQSPPLHACI